MEKSSKRFEDWEEVDCNDCSHYWDSSCDGASRGSRIGCNSFLATRKVVIPERLNALEKNVSDLRFGVIISYIVLIVHLVLSLLGWQ